MKFSYAAALIAAVSVATPALAQQRPATPISPAIKAKVQKCAGTAVIEKNHWGAYQDVLARGLAALEADLVQQTLKALKIPPPDPCSWPEPGELPDHAPPPPKMDIKERALVHDTWNPRNMAARRKEYGLIAPVPRGTIPQPAYPSYLSRPKSVEEMMPKARAAVTQTGGFSPYGIVKPGETVLLVLSWYSDRMVYEAISRAFKERNIEARIIYENELVGIEKSAIEEMFRTQGWGPGSGELESRILFTSALTGVFPDGERSRQWVKAKDPDLYNAIWPDFKYASPAVQRASTIDWTNVTPPREVTEALIKYLDQHTDIDRVFWREAGLFLVGATLRHHKDKFVGHNLYNDYLRLMSRAGEFPSAVWRMVETKTIEALSYADRVEITDPEGTAIAWDLTEEQAQNFAKGAYLQGHLLMNPSMAGGRTPQSLVNYPAYGSDYIKPMFVKSNGVVCSTNAHMGTHPLMCTYVKDGVVTKVEGGGLYGESFRLALHYPGMQELTWPYFPAKGWWRLSETSLATNPKYFKHPLELMRGDNLSERMPAGVIHWAFGAILLEGPELPGMGVASPITQAFGMKYNVPVGHGMHQHTVIPTYQVRIHGTNQWQAIINNGRLTALDDPEVRALAARYGNPDDILSPDYVPPYPGINLPGDFMKDYAQNPGPFWTRWAKSMVEGTNEFLQNTKKKLASR